MPDTPTPSLPELVRPQEHRRRRRKRFRTLRRIRRRLQKLNWRLVAVMVVSGMAMIIMGVLVLVSNARSGANESWSRLSRVWNTLNNTSGTELTLSDFERLQASVVDLQQSLDSAAQKTRPLRPFSGLNADLDTTLKTLDAARHLTLAANDILTGMQPTLFFLTGGAEDDTIVPQLSSGERVVELLSRGRGRFLSASEHLNDAQTILDEMDLASASPDLLKTVDGMTQHYEQMREINDILLDSPDLLSVALGLNETQTYLILSQNSDELRPSGGYVSTYGWMTVRGGRIMEYDYRATTATTPNPPDNALASEIGLPEWWIQYGQPIYAAWDGSWEADFPTTAQMGAWFYDTGGNPQSPVDGVIGIDIMGFEYILEGLGSVAVPGYNEVITPTNFRDAVYEIRAEGEGDVPHKQFIAALYRQILQDWQEADQEQSVELRGTVLRALQEKHIMIYSTDERVNKAFEVLNWAGAQDPGLDQDYLMVADANLGNKSNRSIIRQLTYDVAIQPDGTLDSRLAVAYDYSARVAENDPAVRPAHYSDIDYNNLLQVFVPANSTLTESSNLPFDPVAVQTETHTRFVARTQVEYNQSERFQFTYTTPELIETIGPYRRYRLKLQKQPGMRGELVNVTVTLPPGAEVVTTSIPIAASYSLESLVLEFRVELLTDETIEVIYRQ